VEKLYFSRKGPVGIGEEEKSLGEKEARRHREWDVRNRRRADKEKKKKKAEPDPRAAATKERKRGIRCAPGSSGNIRDDLSPSRLLTASRAGKRGDPESKGELKRGSLSGRSFASA